MPSAASPAKAAPERLRELIAEQRQVLTQKVDRSFVLLLSVEFLAALFGAVLFAQVRPEGMTPLPFGTVFLLALLYAGVPIAFTHWRPGTAETRQCVAVGQMLMSSLFVHLSGGRIETHFHIFGSLAFLAFYRDWRVLVTASTIVAVDHFVRGLYWPQTVFGLAQPDHWRWLEHTGWVVFEDAFLVLAMQHVHDAHRGLILGRMELEAARDFAERASHAKDEFLAVLSHELRTPLTPSLMTLSALVDDPTITADQREELELVHRNVELEARLIDDLLDLTRISQGKLQLDANHVDVHTLLKQLLKTFRGELSEKGLAVEATLEAEQHWLYGDSARLQQVFWNLLKNAMKFTPAGGQIQILTSDVNGKLQVEMVDNGFGISADILPKLFQRFEQGGAQVTRQFGGLGLGLSICKAIVEMHHGSIRAVSGGEGRGATFTVLLPARAAVAVPQRGIRSQTQQLRLSGKLPRRVLLVDDHEDTRRTVERLLTRVGYDVTAVGHLAGAREIARTRQFDLLVSDIGLPDGSGCALMRELQAQYGLIGIAFSGFGMEEDVERSLEAGFSAHLTKPVDFQKLKEALTDALAAKQQGQQREEVR